MQFLITATTPSREASLITGIHVDVSNRTRLKSGVVVANTTGCGANSNNRLMDMNLDQDPVQLGSRDNIWVKPTVPAVRFPVQLTTKDSEAFELSAYTDSFVRFSVKVDWRVHGKTGTSLFDNKQRGYMVAGFGDLPIYQLDAGRKTIIPYDNDIPLGPTSIPQVCGEFLLGGQRVQILNVSGNIDCAVAAKVADAYATGKKYRGWSCSTNSQSATRSTGVFSHCDNRKARVALVRPGIIGNSISTP
ncbi:hypothetical protein ACIQM0_15790 [Streptomyces sp. NPDC091387]|uniref:hypothetical protein n=1 Tax=Streptomyces sp. NPDC091387 TaxID=3365998 RepID=UPI00380B905F